MSKWYPCIYCTEDLKCTKYSDDGSISFCVLGPCHDETPSHGDKIRAMTDEELADWLVLVEQRILEIKPSLEKPALYADWLDWLRQEGVANGV